MMAVAAPGQLNINSPPCGSRSLDCFEKLDQIGQGTYGQVFKAKDKRTEDIVALKRIRMDDEKEGFPISAIREIKILKKLHHENVVKLKEIVVSTQQEQNKDGNKYNGDIYMVLEYMDHDLMGLLAKNRFPAPQIKCYMKQLLTGLHYCHHNELLHRDIKCSNLLINDQGILKLADFGLAKPFSKGNLTNRVITLWYRPPELLLGATMYGSAIDMWSVGCVFAELLTGKPIFQGLTEPEQINRIFQVCGSPDERNWPGASKLPFYKHLKPSRFLRRRIREVFSSLDPYAVDLLDKMLALDPSKRISAQDALHAEYFWTEPLPCDPSSLPKYKSSHEFQIKKERMQLAKRQRLDQQPQQYSSQPTMQHGRQSQVSHGNPRSSALPPVSAVHNQNRYRQTCRSPGGPYRYPPSGSQNGSYNKNRSGLGYKSSTYRSQGRFRP